MHNTSTLTLLTHFGTVPPSAIVVSGIPTQVRAIRHAIGRPRYARHICRVRGATLPQSV